jgi:hypothetical protein
MGSPDQNKRWTAETWITKYRALTNIAKDDTIFCRGNFHIGFYIAEITRSQYNRLWFLYQLQISQCSQLKSAILQCVTLIMKTYFRQQYIHTSQQECVKKKD